MVPRVVCASLEGWHGKATSILMLYFNARPIGFGDYKRNNLRASTMKMEKVIKILCFHIFRIYQYFLIIATLKSESKLREFSQMTCSFKVNPLDKAHTSAPTTQKQQDDTLKLYFLKVEVKARGY